MPETPWNYQHRISDDAFWLILAPDKKARGLWSLGPDGREQLHEWPQVGRLLEAAQDQRYVVLIRTDIPPIGD